MSGHRCQRCRAKPLLPCPFAAFFGLEICYHLMQVPDDHMCLSRFWLLDQRTGSAIPAVLRTYKQWAHHFSVRQAAKLCLAHSHLDRAVAEDRRNGWDVASGLGEPDGQGVAQVVTSERGFGSASDYCKAVGEHRVLLSVIMPEYLGHPAGGPNSIRVDSCRPGGAFGDHAEPGHHFRRGVPTIMWRAVLLSGTPRGLEVLIGNRTAWGETVDR